jgi:glycine cleavage system T protein (aminomethyltransferase)
MNERRQIRATSFHARAAAANLFNRWTARNGFTVSQDYGDAVGEALAARTGAVLTDISWRWRMFIEGPNASACLSHLLTKSVEHLSPGQSLKALWLNDGGAVRGAAAAARYAADQFLLVSSATDAVWLAEVAHQFDVSLRDITEQEGGLALIGPRAKAVLDAAGLNTDIEPLGFHKLFWRNLDVTVSRWGEHDGYEIWCAADDCCLLWDRLMKAGSPHAIRAAGAAAADTLDIEAGVPRPERDYQPATDGFSGTPTPGALGLESLVDESQSTFNGRAAWLAARNSEQTAMVGIEIDSESPAPFVPLMRGHAVVGRTLTSVYSPTLRRGIALAQVETSLAVAGTEFSLTLPMSAENLLTRSVAARVLSLPLVKPATIP